MGTESLNNQLINSFYLSGITCPTDTIPGFNSGTAGVTNQFELAGYLNQNFYTQNISNVTYPNFSFDTSMLMPQNSAATNASIDALYESFTNTMNIQSQQISKLLEGLYSTKPPVVTTEDTSYFDYNVDNLKNKWSDKKPELTDNFYQKVVDIAQKIQCDPNDLMAVMNAESGLKADAVNKASNATGLIQFMPATARELGTTVDELRNMSALEQLDYVEKYLSNAKNIRFGKNEKLDAGELYALTYLPARANRSVLAKSHEKYYTWNRGLDLNGDGKITKAELAQRVQDKQVSDMYFLA